MVSPVWQICLKPPFVNFTFPLKMIKKRGSSSPSLYRVPVLRATILPTFKRHTLTILWFLLKKGLKISNDLRVLFRVISFLFFISLGIVERDLLKFSFALLKTSLKLICYPSTGGHSFTYVFLVAFLFFTFTSWCSDLIRLEFTFSPSFFIFTITTELSRVLVFVLGKSSIFSSMEVDWNTLL